MVTASDVNFHENVLQVENVLIFQINDYQIRCLHKNKDEIIFLYKRDTT